MTFVAQFQNAFRMASRGRKMVYRFNLAFHTLVVEAA